MEVEIESFAKSIADSNLAYVLEKYKNSISGQFSISDIVKSLEKQGLLEKLVSCEWKNDGTDRNGLYLVSCDDKFEVFTGERGIKNWRKEFNDIKSASTYYIDSLLNELGYSAPDTLIK